MDADVGHIGRHEVLYKKRKIAEAQIFAELFRETDDRTDRRYKSSHEEPDLLQEVRRAVGTCTVRLTCCYGCICTSK